MILPELEPFPILFPVIDIANHSVNTKVRWEIEELQIVCTNRTLAENGVPKEASSSTVFPTNPKDPMSRRFKLKILENVPLSGQVFNNYGPKPNAELLLGYGFAVKDNQVEQVPIKLRVSGNASTYTDHVPFGMDPSTLEDGTGGLRKRDNLLGRYRNDIPFFQGIPSFAVFTSYTLALSARGIDMKKFDLANMSGRLVLGTHLFLYEAIHALCKRHPFEQANFKLLSKRKDQHTSQHYARLYRAGQTDICHYIRRELKAVLEKLLKGPKRRQSEAPTNGEFDIAHTPRIVTLSEALWTLQREHPTYYAVFEDGMKKLLNVNISNPVELAKSNAEERIWVFLIIAFNTVM